MSERPTKVRWLIFVLACLASWLLYLHRYAWGVIKPAFREQYPDFTDVEIGWLDSAFLATYAFGQVPSGLAGDRFGPRSVLSILTLVWSLSMLGIAWTSGFWRLIAAPEVFGLAQAGAYPILNKITRAWYPLSVRTTVQGFVTALGRIGGASASVLIATVLMGVFALSWERALVVIAVPGIALAASLWLSVRDNPRVHPWTNAAEQDLVDGAPPPATERPMLELTYGSMFSLAMMLLYIFASTFQDQFYVNWLPSFLKEGKGFDTEAMGLLAPWPLVGGAIGGIVGGFLNDYFIRRTGNHRWSRSLVAFTGKTIAALMVIASLEMTDGRWTVALSVAARVFSDWSLPTQWAAVTDMGGRAAATLFGIVNTVGALGGFVAGPVLGWLKADYGWDGQLYGVAGMCLFAACTWLFIDCTKRVVAD